MKEMMQMTKQTNAKQTSHHMSNPSDEFLTNKQDKCHSHEGQNRRGLIESIGGIWRTRIHFNDIKRHKKLHQSLLSSVGMASG